MRHSDDGTKTTAVLRKLCASLLDSIPTQALPGPAEVITHFCAPFTLPLPVPSEPILSSAISRRNIWMTKAPLGKLETKLARLNYPKSTLWKRCQQLNTLLLISAYSETRYLYITQAVSAVFLSRNSRKWEPNLVFINKRSLSTQRLVRQGSTHADKARNTISSCA